MLWKRTTSIHYLLRKFGSEVAKTKISVWNGGSLPRSIVQTMTFPYFFRNWDRTHIAEIAIWLLDLNSIKATRPLQNVLTEISIWEINDIGTYNELSAIPIDN